MTILTNDIFKDFSVANLIVWIEDFAIKSNNNYGKRAQKDSKLIFDDIVIGKKAEWIAYYALKPLLTNLTQPDMMVYLAKQKNWAVDMKAGNIGLACKGCAWDTVQYAGLSWVFQKSDSDGYGKDAGIYGRNIDNDLFVGVEINYDNITGHIASILPIRFLRDNNLFIPPKKVELRPFKDVVDYMSLTCLGIKRGRIHPSVIELIERCQKSPVV